MLIKITADTPIPDHVLADERVQRCTGPCNRWTRSMRMLVTDFPGTIQRNASGSCQGCANEEHRNDPERKRQAEMKFQRTLNSLSAYTAARNARLAAKGGTRNA